ncbi:MAG: ABC transporter permease [Pirellulales bacterium]|nr:ABC transporter permease [Pirellulales bacterium]
MPELNPDFDLAKWFPAAAADWGLQIAALTVLGLIVGFVLSSVRLGPLAGARRVGRFVASAVGDLARISPRRVFALARLAVLESIRRMVLAAFVVFVVILLFAGWYLDPTSSNPARLYLSFVLSATSLLSALLALFLSVFSLPNDIRTRTIYTVVTKPVRPSEIVLGRILGFSLIGTVMLLLTGVSSYFFVLRGLDHSHEVVDASLEPEASAAGSSGALVGRTSAVHNHRHQVRIDAQSGTGQTSFDQGHDHDVTRVEVGGKTRYRLGPPRGHLVARRPIYGQLQMLNRQGEPGGIDIGKESKRQSWIEGGTQAAAIWTFSGLSEQQFPDGLPLELTLGVFRTAQGDVSQGVLGAITLRNPHDRTKVSAPRNFVAQDYKSDLHRIPREVQAPDGSTLDLYRDLVHDGRLEIEITCLQGEQYLGMGQTDAYLRPTDGSFALNFFKGYIGIWLQMLIITTVGVTLSTFLNAAVAMLGNLVLILGGFVKPYILDVATDRVIGGGPIESLVRIVRQMNQTIPLEPGFTTTAIKSLDVGYRAALKVMANAVPDLSSLSGTTLVARGYDIPWNPLVSQVLMALAYVVPVFVVGYLFFKMREVAR